MVDVLLTGIGHLTTNVADSPGGDAVAIENGTIIFVGDGADAPPVGKGTHIDCRGMAVLPGFVDAHTHLVFAGDRSSEFSARMSGAGYAEIAESGGGIQSTVEATRRADADELFRLASERVWTMIRSGTTTIEVKSGYGLNLDTEIRILEVARRIERELPVTVKTTFLGAHTIPREFKADRAGYIELVISEMIPAVSGLSDYCDVFVEENVFSVDEARSIFAAGSTHGLRARVHAEQLAHSGGAGLAAEIGAASADHLDHVDEEDAARLAAADVSAVLVPGASYSLRADQAPGPMLIEAGCNVAIATDCNPGTSYFEGMGPVISLAVVQMGLTTDQAVYGATRGGALSLGLEDRGVIEPGARGDLIVLDAPTPSHIPYRPATNLVTRVVSGGVVAL